MLVIILYVKYSAVIWRKFLCIFALYSIFITILSFKEHILLVHMSQYLLLVETMRLVR